MSNLPEPLSLIDYHHQNDRILHLEKSDAVSFCFLPKPHNWNEENENKGSNFHFSVPKNKNRVSIFHHSMPKHGKKDSFFCFSIEETENRVSNSHDLVPKNEEKGSFFHHSIPKNGREDDCQGECLIDHSITGRYRPVVESPLSKSTTTRPRFRLVCCPVGHNMTEGEEGVNVIRAFGPRYWSVEIQLCK